MSHHQYVMTDYRSFGTHRMHRNVRYSIGKTIKSNSRGKNKFGPMSLSRVKLREKGKSQPSFKCGAPSAIGQRWKSFPHRPSLGVISHRPTLGVISRPYDASQTKQNTRNTTCKNRRRNGGAVFTASSAAALHSATG
jgi:hypothetical protein